jgi:putative PIN family toxin of toxin-antitoxin system
VPSRVVLDTNVYISAYGFGGLPARLLRAAILSEFALVTSPALLAEVGRVLSDRLEFDSERTEATIMQIARIATIVRPTERLSVVADEPDNRVLECALAGGADTIVSGDRHLLELGEYAGIRVMSVAQAVEGLARSG